MIKNMLNNKKGGLAVIISSTASLVIITVLFVNIVYSLLHLSMRNYIEGLIQTEADVIVQNKAITKDTYEFFDKDIQKYSPILKNYSTTYTVYTSSNGSISQVCEVTGDSNVNLKLTSGEIIQITIKQTSISTLQKLVNLTSSQNGQTGVEIVEKRFVQ